MFYDHRFLKSLRSFFLAVTLLLLLVGALQLNAQQPPLSISFEHRAHNLMENRIRKQGDTLRHTAVKPLLQGKYADHERVHTLYKPQGNWFSRKLFGEHLINYQGRDWSVQIDPLFDFTFGHDFMQEKNTWVNTRGFQLQGNIGKNLAFYSSFFENQAMMPKFINDFVYANQIMPVVPGVGILPGQGIARTFKDQGAWDYGNATGYLSWSPLPMLNLQFGHDNHFVGHGYRSLLLSDAAFPYAYFRLQTELGPFQYTYWLMQHIDPGAQPLAFHLGFRKKYAAMGYLNWQVFDKLQLGVFQAVVWPGDDSIGGSNPPAWQFMNPVVFFHPIHLSSGSEGNLLFGINMQWEILRNRFLYAQLMLDEFVKDEFFKQSGSVRNKYGGQLGFKAFDFLTVRDLFFLAELNIVRPYTYSHVTRMTNYAHYLQPLAHPSGANFSEFMLMADYHFRPEWYASVKYVHNVIGLDTNNVNFGSNVFLSYYDAPGGLEGTGADVGWGLKSTLNQVELALGYLINPKTNMKLEAKYIYRNQGTQGNFNSTSWFMFGFRTSLRNLYYDF